MSEGSLPEALIGHLGMNGVLADAPSGLYRKKGSGMGDVGMHRHLVSPLS